MSTSTEVEHARRGRREFTADEPGPSSRVRIDVDRGGPAITIDVRGELDAYTLPVLRSAMREATGHPAPSRPVIVDISRLDFIACGALVALALDGDMCRGHGVDLLLVSRASTVPRAAAAIGLSGRLPIYPNLETALQVSAGFGAHEAGNRR